MKINREIIMFFVSLPLFVYQATAQPLSGYGEENLRELGGEGDNLEMVQTYDSRYEGVKGTPFLIDEWAYGQILTVNNQKFDSVQLKYDLQQQNILYRYFVDSNEVVKIANPDVVDQFVIYDPQKPTAYMFDRLEYTMPDSDQPKVGFFQVLQSENDTYLLIKREVHFRRANFRGAYNYGQKYDEFEKTKQLYVLKDNDELFKLNKNQKSVLKAFKDKKRDIKRYIKSENMEFNEQRDLIEVFNYYASL